MAGLLGRGRGVSNIYTHKKHTYLQQSNKKNPKKKNQWKKLKNNKELEKKGGAG